MDSLRILLVDDETELRKALGRTLLNRGYRVETSRSGASALELIRSAHRERDAFEILITDINMPEMRGDELVDALHHEGIEPEILAITGYGDKETVVRLLRLGVTEYLDKPFTLAEFVHRLDALRDRAMARRTQKAASSELQTRVARLSVELSHFQRGLEEMQEQFRAAVGSHAILTSLPSDIPGLAFAPRVRPLNALGGDYFGIHRLGRGFEILVADVAGHDMGASYLTILLKVFFENNVEIGADGPTFLKLLNSGLVQRGGERAVTAVHAFLDPVAHTVAITTAAHEPPILLRQDPDALAIPINSWGEPLGIAPTVALESWTGTMAAGDRLFLFTDGMETLSRYDPATGRREQLGREGLMRLLLAWRPLPLTQMVGRTWDDALSFSRFHPTDDLLLLGVELSEVLDVPN